MISPIKVSHIDNGLVQQGALQTAGMSLSYQYAGRFLAGFGVGVSDHLALPHASFRTLTVYTRCCLFQIESSVCPNYVAELAPAHIRGNLTGLFQVCVVIGVALSYWINYACSFMEQQTNSWRIPVAMQLVPVGIMFFILPFIKESPRWLVSKDRRAQALRDLAWVRNRSEDDYRVVGEMSEIIAAVEEEREALRGAVWYKEITLKGKPLRFFIAVMMFVCQQWSGQNR